MKRSLRAPCVALCFFALPLLLLFLFTRFLLGVMDAAMLLFILLFSVFCGGYALFLYRCYPAVLFGFGGGLLLGLFALAIAFEGDTLGSYGLLQLFTWLFIGLALGAVGEAVLRLMRRRRAAARREAYLSRLLYKK